MDHATVRIEVCPDVDGGWCVSRDRIVEGCFADRMAANDYAAACARRAERAGMRVCLQGVPPEAHVAAA